MSPTVSPTPGRLVNAPLTAATHAEASNLEASNLEASNLEASNLEASNLEASNLEASSAAAREAEPRPRELAVSLAGISKRFPVTRPWRAMLAHPRDRQFVDVLKDVSIDIPVGEFFGLLGPNGAGKTTLFKILSTTVLPDSGTATVGGFDVARDADHVRQLLTPVIADERSLHWRLSALENLRLFATLHGLRGSLARERIDEALEITGLAEAAEKSVGTFSSGMKQRLLIARALLARPRVLLLDEPTRSLDPISARAFRQFLRDEISARQGCTVLLATHNAEEALELCTRVVILDRGRMLASGATTELAREFADDRYRMWSTEAANAALQTLEARGSVRHVTRDANADSEGWYRIELEIPGELDGAARVVQALVRAGVPVARFERVELSLAELLERVVARRQEAATRSQSVA